MERRRARVRCATASAKPVPMDPGGEGAGLARSASTRWTITVRAPDVGTVASAFDAFSQARTAFLRRFVKEA
jgi:hypothetical protein